MPLTHSISPILAVINSPLVPVGLGN